MREEDIRKRDTFNKYLELAEKDAAEFFGNKDAFIRMNCPACGGSKLNEEFEKLAFRYVSCGDCGTLFVNPRPNFSDLSLFYANSPSTHYWVNEFFKPVQEARRTAIFRPRAEYIKSILPDAAKGVVGDIGAGFGIFLEELKIQCGSKELIAIEPSQEQASICRQKGLKVEEKTLEEIKGHEGRYDLLVAFELLEHLYDPLAFLQRVNRLLKPNCCFYATTLNGQGFDIQILWDKSKSVHPPHHLNFFNPVSASTLLERSEFEIIDISTPGELDWEIVEGMIKKEGKHPGRFWKFLAEHGSEKTKKKLQEWIKSNNLSSHLRLVARKK